MWDYFIVWSHMFAYSNVYVTYLVVKHPVGLGFMWLGFPCLVSVELGTHLQSSTKMSTKINMKWYTAISKTAKVHVS